MVLLLGDRSCHRFPLVQVEALPEGCDQRLQLGAGEAAECVVELLDLGWGQGDRRGVRRGSRSDYGMGHGPGRPRLPKPW